MTGQNEKTNTLALRLGNKLKSRRWESTDAEGVNSGPIVLRIRGRSPAGLPQGVVFVAGNRVGGLEMSIRKKVTTQKEKKKAEMGSSWVFVKEAVRGGREGKRQGKGHQTLTSATLTMIKSRQIEEGEEG